MNLGCGIGKREGFINVDKCAEVNPDVLWDLNNFPYPFEDNSFNEITAYSILEHIDNTIKVMEEIHRIAKPGTLIEITVPYWDGYGFASDPTHKSMFTEHTFTFFTGKADYSFITTAKFEIVEMTLQYHPRLKYIPKFIKKRLRFLLKEIVIGLRVTLKVIK